MSAGRIVFASQNSAMLVVRHEDGYALIEMLGDEGAIVLGDEVLGDWDALGGEPIYCQGSRYDAYFQGTWGSPDAPVKMARSCGG
jgi:hypothetical protein